jgi:hypothetical protein
MNTLPLILTLAVGQMKSRLFTIRLCSRFCAISNERPLVLSSAINAKIYKAVNESAIAAYANEKKRAKYTRFFSFYIVCIHFLSI